MADLVVVLVAGSERVRSSAGQTSVGTGLVDLAGDASHRVLTHEMAHALVGLGDEYVEVDARHYVADLYVEWTRNPLSPNLSLSPEGDWNGLVEGAIEGGGRYARGVYRPTDACRMRDAEADVAFCAVCSAAIDEVLAARRGVSDGPPRCGLAWGPVRAGGVRDVTYFGRDADGIDTATLAVDGVEGPPVDLSIFRLPGSRLPVWFAVDSSVASTSEITLSCTDALGEVGEAALGR